MNRVTKVVRVASVVLLAFVLAVAHATVEAVPASANGGYCPAADEYCVDGPYADPNQRHRCHGDSCDTYNYICCLDEIVVH